MNKYFIKVSDVDIIVNADNEEDAISKIVKIGIFRTACITDKIEKFFVCKVDISENTHIALMKTI